MSEKIGVRKLKNIGVFYEGDLYDLACLLLKAYDAKDKGTNTKSRHTVYGLARDYAYLVRVNDNHVLAVIQDHDLPLGATVEFDEDMEKTNDINPKRS